MWLNRLLVAAAVMACISAILAYLLADVIHRPLHPVAAAAEEPSPIEPSGALLAITPRATNTALPLETLAETNHSETSATVDNQSADMTSNHKNSAEGNTSVDKVRRGYGDDSLLPAANDERMTILLMGVDSRLGRSIVSRTDVMILISFNPGRDTISILSIPRDLYVSIPGHGPDRINTAFVHGSDVGNPADGAALAMQTVENALGIAIDHYVLVDFSTLIRIIDALGGVHVYVPYTIDDPTYPDMNYGYEPLYISEGLHHFDGVTALKYARTRHQDNDFYRAQRQQQVIFAIRRQAMGLGFLDLISRAPALYRRVNSGVFTDLSLEEIVQIGRVAHDIPEENIRTGVLNYDYVRDHWTETGSHVLLLKHKEVFALVEEMFDNSQ